MKLCLFVNDVAAESPEYTTTRLAVAAGQRGHDVWYVGAGDFQCADDEVAARAWHAPDGVTDREGFLSGAAEGARERVSLEDFDILLLRSDPADELPERHWAATAGLMFGDLAAERGVVVLNAPSGLWRATTKLYLESLPRDVRPETVVTRDVEEVRAFVEAHGGRAVLKPLQGSGGEGVFIVTPGGDVNLSQMVEALARDGYLAVQELLPGAEEGDTRLFLLDGKPLRSGDAYAAFRRIPAEGEARSNMSVGATVAPAEIDATILGVAERVGPHLGREGMFLVGLDIIGDRLLEANVFSAGGLRSVQETTGVDFAPIIIEALERKVAVR